jgi:hypothetical protein
MRQDQQAVTSELLLLLLIYKTSGDEQANLRIYKYLHRIDDSFLFARDSS